MKCEGYSRRNIKVLKGMNENKDQCALLSYVPNADAPVAAVGDQRQRLLNVTVSETCSPPAESLTTNTVGSLSVIIRYRNITANAERLEYTPFMKSYFQV